MRRYTSYALLATGRDSDAGTWTFHIGKGARQEAIDLARSLTDGTTRFYRRTISDDGYTSKETMRLIDIETRGERQRRQALEIT
jgi:hypothetical protein